MKMPYGAKWRAAIPAVLALTAGVYLDGHAAAAPPPNDRPTAYGLTYGEPFIDVDEWRDTPRRHRYVHGGFKGSHLRFSVYLPPKELFKDRFLLMMEGGTGGLDKMLTQRQWAWAYDLAFDDMGAYLVETNEGHYPDEGLGVSDPKDLWQAGAYATRYAKLIAGRMYGTAPKFGYATGCSGGGLRSSIALEEAPDLIQGSVSQAWNQKAPLDWSAYARLGAFLGPEKTAALADATDVGGPADVYAGLSPVQRDAAEDFFRMGWSRDAATQMKSQSAAAVYILHGLHDQSPTYFTDFWTKPGYEGHDNPRALDRLLVDRTVEVERTVTVRELGEMGGYLAPNPDIATYGAEKIDIANEKYGAVLKIDDPKRVMMSKITILSGPDTGKWMYAWTVSGDVVIPFVAVTPFAFNNVKPGDKVRVDNRDFLAYLYFFRHSVDRTAASYRLRPSEYKVLLPEMKAVMDGDGKPRHPQVAAPKVLIQKARFSGKMIMLSGTADELEWPTSDALYAKAVRRNHGDEADQHFRHWFLERVPHCSGPTEGPRSTSQVPATGITRQALLDVMRWVEDGVAPAPSTRYSFTADNALVLEEDAARRGGVQPLVRLAANGGVRAETQAGTAVAFTASAQTPPGGGQIVKAEFDFDGQGTWPEAVRVDGSSGTVTANASHAYDKPGTYFAAFRVASHRMGAKGKGEPIYNLARVRVVVK